MRDDALWGYREYRLTGENFERFFTSVTDEEYRIYAIRYTDGGVFFRSGLLSDQALKDIAASLELELETTDSGGFPLLLYRRRHRYGLAAGLLSAAFFIFFMSLFVFDISVSGNTTLYEEDILEVLRQNGLYEGALSSSLHSEELRLALLEAFDNISYAIINIKGSYAEILITERKLPPSVPAKSPCNVIASESGQIVRFETYMGDALLTRGAGVKKGELLVSGVLTCKYIGYRTVHASALVMARTRHTLTLYQEYDSFDTQPTGKTETFTVLKICGVIIPLSGSQRATFENYYEQSSTTRLAAGDNIYLPVSVTKIVRYELADIPVSYTEAEAAARLQKQAAELERVAFSGLETETREEKFKADGNGLTLTVDCTVIKNIAEQQELYTGLPG